jgi:membrane-associated phospholipid phosphatase
MFQTEPIHALQSLASEGLTAFMVAVTSLGYAYMLIPILVVIAFGINFRRGFVLVYIVLLTAAVTSFLKATFALPRPEAVDSTLLQLGDDDPEVYPFERRGAPGFWAPLPADVVSYYRGIPGTSWGIPSGHSSITTALWGSMALLFRRRWLWALSLSLIVLVPLSRMYLARHFLADVLAGVALGGLVVVCAWQLALGPLVDHRRRSPLLSLPLSAEAQRFTVYLVLPVAAIYLPGVGLEHAMRMTGVSVGLWLLTRTGLPLEMEEDWKRFARVVLAITLYFATSKLLGGLSELLLGDEEMVEYLIEGASTFALTWGTTTLSYRLGLYERGEPGAGLLASA